MVRQTKRPARPATVLVASGSPPFEQSAAQLLVASGFVAACAFEWEAARLSVTRTQPRVVLIDGTSTIPHVCMVAEEAAARGIPLLLAHRENEFNDALSAFGARAQHMVGISLPLSADALRTSLTALLEPAGAGPVAQLPASPRRVTPEKDTPLLRRRDSLASTLHEIESGGLKGVGVLDWAIEIDGMVEHVGPPSNVSSTRREVARGIREWWDAVQASATAVRVATPRGEG